MHPYDGNKEYAGEGQRRILYVKKIFNWEQSFMRSLWRLRSIGVKLINLLHPIENKQHNFVQAEESRELKLKGRQGGFLVIIEKSITGIKNRFENALRVWERDDLKL